MSCAATRMGWLRAASTTAGSSVGEAQTTTSAWLWGATSGRNALMKATASSGVLYIFQLAAMRVLRGIRFIFLSYDFRLELPADLDRRKLYICDIYQVCEPREPENPFESCIGFDWDEW